MIYFDNAATSFPKPPSVMREIYFCLKNYSGNPGRSGHRLSIAAAEKIYETREILSEHFGISCPENIIFTYNATYALNIAIMAKIKPFSHVITSDIEHNAVIRPLERLSRECGVSYSRFSSSGDIKNNIRSLIKPNTKAIVSTLASNVTGRCIPIEILSSTAKEFGLILIVDASQSAGHENINLNITPCDAFCAPGHKGLYGIQGSGFVYFSSSDDISPFIVGGSGTNSKSRDMPDMLPEKFEAGTLSTPTIAALYAGVRFVNSVGIDDIKEKEYLLAKSLKEGLSLIKGVSLYDSCGSIILFNLIGIKEDVVCSELDKEGICVRGGLHCAPDAHRLIGTYDTGAVRLSLSYFNTKNEADNFLKIMNKIAAETC